MTDGVTILGVRHHGPGSARSVARALERLAPDIVLVEGPPDAQHLIPFAAAPGMRPPVALVVYPADRPGGGVFYPFVSFSPEWIALRYALAHGVPARFCDLPQAVVLANRPDDESEQDDPVAELARAAGDDDPERWWERLVEQRADDADVFAAVTEAMAAVREASLVPPEHEQRREAHMRQTIRNALREGCTRVAVVCGAWHAPALDTLPPARGDQALLRGLKRIKVESTWVPWTTSRLAYASGYGAGVESPAWYRHLWETDGDVVSWLTAAARLLRSEDLDASPAEVVEAVRLTDALAALRGRPQPSLSEVTDATLSILCHGEPSRLALVHKQLVIGEELGAVPPGVPTVPLQRDLEAQARRLRLRAVPEERTLDLDLRQPNQLGQSRLLHRLRILNVDWGRLQPLPVGSLGTFHELWSLRWRPELVLQVVSAGVYGNTVAEAAAAKSVERAAASQDLADIASIIELALLADLDAAIPRLVEVLGARSAESSDVSQMLRALGPLATTLRYGDVRRTATAALGPVVRAIGQRSIAGLVPACAGLDDESANSLVASIVAASQAMGLLVTEDDVALVEGWWAALRSVVDRRATARVVGGTCTRLLLNAEQLDDASAAAFMERALARGTEPADAARWLEGFLRVSPGMRGSGLMLATSARLFGLVDAWLSSLQPGQFEQVLPLVRRTMSTFSKAERRQIGERVASGEAVTLLGGTDDLDPERAALVEPIVLSILGIQR